MFTLGDVLNSKNELARLEEHQVHVTRTCDGVSLQGLIIKHEAERWKWITGQARIDAGERAKEFFDFFDPESDMLNIRPIVFYEFHDNEVAETF
jgi:hypothetical protein